MNLELIKDGIILFISLICGLYVLEYAPKDSIHYKAFIILCILYIGVTIFSWIKYFNNRV